MDRSHKALGIHFSKSQDYLFNIKHLLDLHLHPYITVCKTFTYIYKSTNSLFKHPVLGFLKNPSNDGFVSNRRISWKRQNFVSGSSKDGFIKVTDFPVLVTCNTVLENGESVSSSSSLTVFTCMVGLEIIESSRWVISVQRDKCVFGVRLRYCNFGPTSPCFA